MPRIIHHGSTHAQVAAKVAKKLRKLEKGAPAGGGSKQAAASAATPPVESVTAVQVRCRGGARAGATLTWATAHTEAVQQAGGKVRLGFYKEHKATAKRPSAEIAAWREANKISEVEGAGEQPPPCPGGVRVCGLIRGAEEDVRPILDFAHAGFSPALLQATAGFKAPSAIQAQCWPIVLAGRDCIGIAKTGSGKTLAFGLPGLLHCEHRGAARPSEPFMLVVSPTRELAVQTAEVCAEAGSRCKPQIRTVCVYGGVSKHEQIRGLKGCAAVVVATPGRLYDLMEQRALSLAQVSFVVLDEADQMLDLGFEREIQHFVQSSRSDRQTVMFSATWPVEVQVGARASHAALPSPPRGTSHLRPQAIGRSYMRDPLRVTVGVVDRLVSNHAVKQVVEVLEPHEKDARLLQVLKEFHRGKGAGPKGESVLVFALYKKEAARLERALQSKGFDASAIHGDLSQDRRTQILDNFRAGTLKIMIATDVAARGLDVPFLKFVINYTFPLTVESYVHRVGRTGRAGATGTAHTFFTQQEKGLAGGLGNVLREAGMPVPEKLMNFGQGTKRKKHAVYGELTATREAMAGKKATRITFDD